MSEGNKLDPIPDEGLLPDEILRAIHDFREEDIPWREGKTWSLMYHADDAHESLLKAASEAYFSSNYLNPLAFKGLKKMEQEVVGMVSEMLHGDNQVCGTMTSGGTESLLLALYTYREWAKKAKPHVHHPEVVAPSTIHPAHDKAAHLFGLKLRKARADEGQAAMPSEMEKLINKNTILICASAPSYPHGILDPVEGIADLAIKHKLPMHVDSCIGGFMLPWVEALGYGIPAWDFRVPGVTSMSADIHKFGYGAKGASVILYRGMQYLKHQFYISTDFPGGIYASPTLLGTRAGGPIAAAWASLKHMGKSGYIRQAEKLMKGREKMEALLNEIPEVSIIGQPCMNILSYTTKNNIPDLFAVSDAMEKKGWFMDRQQLPDSIHLTLLPTNVPVVDEYIRDLKEAIAYCKANPSVAGEGNAALYGMMARVPLRGMVRNNVRKIFEEMYGRGGENGQGDEMPEQQLAPVKPWMGWLSRLLAFLKKF